MNRGITSFVYSKIYGILWSCLLVTLGNVKYRITESTIPQGGPNLKRESEGATSAVRRLLSSDSISDIVRTIIRFPRIPLSYCQLRAPHSERRGSEVSSGEFRGIGRIDTGSKQCKVSALAAMRSTFGTVKDGWWARFGFVSNGTTKVVPLQPDSFFAAIATASSQLPASQLRTLRQLGSLESHSRGRMDIQLSIHRNIRKMSTYFFARKTC